eukprot:1186536-Prorocentrum_minimum.AAC.5
MFAKVILQKNAPRVRRIHVRVHVGVVAANTDSAPAGRRTPGRGDSFVRFSSLVVACRPVHNGQHDGRREDAQEELAPELDEAKHGDCIQPNIRDEIAFGEDPHLPNPPEPAGRQRRGLRVELLWSLLLQWLLLLISTATAPTATALTLFTLKPPRPESNRAWAGLDQYLDAPSHLATHVGTI